MNLLGFRCQCCQGKLNLAQHGLCCRCNKRISRFIYCGHCGSPVPYYASSCGNCLRYSFNWDRMIIVGHYTDPLSVLIHRFKFQNQFWLDRTLARLMLLAIYEAKRQVPFSLPDVIIPVPLSHLRQWQRGYNQSDLIAQHLAKWLNIPMNNQCIKRIRHTKNQRGLSAEHRKNNLKNAFQIVGDLKDKNYRSVALIDDVITTGSTLNEIAKLIRMAGIPHIQVWGLAKT